MYQHNPKTFRASGTIAQNTFVAITSGGLVKTAGADDAPIGVAVLPAASAGNWTTVDLLSKGGTMQVVAGGSVSAGDKLAPDSAGKAVSATSSGGVYGIALQGGSSGAIIEVMPVCMQAATVTVVSSGGQS